MTELDPNDPNNLDEQGEQGEQDDLEVRISRYIDGEIDAAEREAFESELLSDPAARCLYESTLDIDEMAHRALRERIADGAMAGSSARISASEYVPSSAPVPVFRTWVRVAALLLVTLGAWTVFELSREEQLGPLGPEMVERPASQDSGDRQEIQNSRPSGSKPAVLPVDVSRMLVGGDAPKDRFDEILAPGAEENLRREYSAGGGAAFTQTLPSAVTQMRPSAFTQMRGERWTQRRLIGVTDEENKGLYLLEVEHTKIRVQPVRLDL